MADQIDNTTSQATDQVGSAGSTAMKAAAAAVAAGTAAVMARKAFSSGGNGSEKENGSGKENGRSGDVASKATALSSMAAGGLDAARDALLPALEEAAGAAGTFLAENGPDLVRDRLVPRFIESFNEAHGT